MHIYMPTKVIRGENCVKQNQKELILGKKAFIVTGRSSGSVSGGLDDVIAVLNDNNTDYVIYDKTGNNPTLEEVYAAGRFAKECGADFVVGIGGGSPLDAAKAVAVFAVNDIAPMDIFGGSFTHPPLPIAAIPTTAGTGSEVTQYSILTLNDEQNKRSFACNDIFPKVAFLDGRYTAGLPHRVAIDTAVDALSHCIEGYVSNRANEYTDILAVEGMRIFGRQIQNLLNNTFDFDTRDRLLYASTLGGMVIAHTATTIVHSMGYQLTYHRDLPHGRANGILLGEFLEFNYDCRKEKIDTALNTLGLDSVKEFKALLQKLTPCPVKLDRGTVEKYISVAIKAKNVEFNPKPVSYEDEMEIMMKSCG